MFENDDETLDALLFKDTVSILLAYGFFILYLYHGFGRSNHPSVRLVQDVPLNLIPLTQSPSLFSLL